MATLQKRLFLFAALAIFLMAIFYFSSGQEWVQVLQEALSVEGIKHHHSDWLAYYHSHPTRSILIFFIFNLVVAMLPLAGVSMVSFLGGALFGLMMGAMLSSLATAFGNFMAFMLARILLKSWVLERYQDKLILFKEEWHDHGPWALFSIRLFVFIPSFVANLVMGISHIHPWTFFWVGWLGRIPIVLVYANAGYQLANIQAAKDILSLPVLGSLLLMAFLPWPLRYLKRRYFKNKTA